MARATTESCPRCGCKHTTRTDSRTERHGQIIDIDTYECDSCSLEFERRF